MQALFIKVRYRPTMERVLARLVNEYKHHCFTMPDKAMLGSVALSRGATAVYVLTLQDHLFSITLSPTMTERPVESTSETV